MMIMWPTKCCLPAPMRSPALLATGSASCLCSQKKNDSDLTALNVIDGRSVQALSKFYFERTLPFLFCSRHLLCPNSAAASSEGCICRPITSYSTSPGCPTSKSPSNAAFKAAPDGSFVAQHVSCMHCSPAGRCFVWGSRPDRLI